MYEAVKKSDVKKGSISLIFQKKGRWQKYLAVILIAIPIWYIVQLYAKYSPELADALGLQFSDTERKTVPINAIMLTYLGLTLGDFACGLISQKLRSRKKAILGFMIASITFIVLFFLLAPISQYFFYTGIFILGFTGGYWAVFMSTAAESFGTNIRSTVTNTAPNFVRGSVVLINLMYEFFKYSMNFNSKYANIFVGILVFTGAIWAWTKLEETFGKDLNYVEN
jgi:hypothetical protein